MRARLPTLIERLALAVAAGAATMLVLAWAGVRWRTAAVMGAAAGLLVLVAAGVAATIPSPHESPQESPHESPHESPAADRRLAP